MHVLPIARDFVGSAWRFPCGRFIQLRPARCTSAGTRRRAAVNSSPIPIRNYPCITPPFLRLTGMTTPTQALGTSEECRNVRRKAYVPVSMPRGMNLNLAVALSSKQTEGRSRIAWTFHITKASGPYHKIITCKLSSRNETEGGLPRGPTYIDWLLRRASRRRPILAAHMIRQGEIDQYSSGSARRGFACAAH